MLLLLREQWTKATTGVDFRGRMVQRGTACHAGLGCALDGNICTVAEHHCLGLEFLCRGKGGEVLVSECGRGVACAAQDNEILLSKQNETAAAAK